MELDQETIKEFRDIYFKEFAETLTDQEAEAMIFRLLNLLRTIRYGGVSEVYSSHASSTPG